MHHTDSEDSETEIPVRDLLRCALRRPASAVNLPWQNAFPDGPSAAVQLEAADLFSSGRRLRPAVASALLPVLLRHTNLRSVLSPDELAHAVAASGCVEALPHLHPDELERVVDRLRASRHMRADFLAAAVQRLRLISADTSLSFAFAADPLSEHSVGQHWLFTSDGSNGVRLLRYTGIETDILIPHRVGTRAVTQIDPRAFRLSRRLSSAQRVARRNIAHVEFPGSVEAIPAGLFEDCEKALASVILRDGTLRIDEAAFSGCALHTIVLPRTVTEVGARAFEDCTKLTHAAISPRLRVIDDATFQGCLSLRMVPDLRGVAQVGARAFRGSGIRHVRLPAQGPWFASFVFADCESLTLVTMEDGADYVPWGAFADCHELTDVQLADSVRVLDRDAFARCRSLPEVHLPYGLIHIAKHAFQECWALEEIEIPRTVRSIGEGAFEGCASLQHVLLGGSPRLRPRIFASCLQLTDVDLPDSLEEIPDEMFVHCSSLADGSLPSRVRRIGAFAYSDTALRTIVLPEHVTDVGKGAFSECATLRHVTVSGNPHLHPAVFAGCRQLSQADLPDAEEIPLETFRGCTTLRTFRFPAALKTIGPGAFAGSALEQACLPGGLRELGDGAFAHCTYLQAVTFEEMGGKCSATRIPARAFLGCTALRSVTIPKGVQEIRDAAFRSSGIERIVIPASVRKIHPYAFADCEELKEVLFEKPDDRALPPLEIGAWAFCGCTALRSIEFPSRTRSIGQSAFENSALRSVTIPESVHHVGAAAFRGIQQLRYAVIEAGGADIAADSVFQDCTNLTEAVFAGDVTRIGAQAFRRTGLRTLQIPDSITHIGSSAFRGCNALQSVHFDSAPQMGSDVFRECHHLRDVFLPDSLRQIPPRMFRNCTRLREIRFPSGLEVVGERAFQSTGLHSALLPNSVRTVGAGAFFGCRHLDTVRVPADAHIGPGAFLRCPGLADADGTVIVNGIIYGNGTECRYASFDSKGRVRAPQEKIGPRDELAPLVLPEGMDDMALDPLLVLPEITYRKPVETTSTPALPQQLTAGDLVQFGRFPQSADFKMEAIDWIVLEADDEQALLAAQRALLFVRSSSTAERISAVLIPGFLQAAFTSEERDRLLPVKGTGEDLITVFTSHDARMYQTATEPTEYSQRMWDMYHAGRLPGEDVGRYAVPVIRIRLPKKQ